jgi:hypothetical protein
MKVGVKLAGHLESELENDPRSLFKVNEQLPVLNGHIG